MKNVEIMSIVASYLKGTSFKLPVSVAWKRRLNMDKLAKAKAVIDEALKEAVAPYLDDEHSTESEDGGRAVKPEYLNEFYKVQEEILAQETDVDIKKISIEELGDLELTDSDMDTLAFMIEE